jgi:hypothetical protein
LTTGTPDGLTGGISGVKLFEEPKTFQVRWVDGASEMQPEIVNLSAVQLAPDGIILTFGFTSIPLLPGSEEEQKEALASLKELKVYPRARIFLTFDKFRELSGALNNTLEVLQAMGGVLASDQSPGEGQQ